MTSNLRVGHLRFSASFDSVILRFPVAYGRVDWVDVVDTFGVSCPDPGDMDRCARKANSGIAMNTTIRTITTIFQTGVPVFAVSPAAATATV